MSSRTPYHQILINPFPPEAVLMDKVLARAKAIVGLLVPLAATGVAVVDNADITKWWLVVVAVLTALGVHFTPNKTVT